MELDARPARTFTIALAYDPPLCWEELIAFLAKRAIAGVEEVDGLTYRRSVALGKASGVIEVRLASGGRNVVHAAVQGIEPGLRGQVVQRIRRMLDLDADPAAIAAHLSRDRRLAPLIKESPGLRLPLTWDPFEAVVRAVLGQQISVAGAITIAGRLCARFGRKVRGPGGISRVFPGPAQIARADLSSIGIPGARARTLCAVARAIHSGKVRLDGTMPREELSKRLLEVPGIGPWSLQYICLRGLGEPDAFPESDLGIRKALARRGYPESKIECTKAIGRLAPWRGYAALYLWKTLSASHGREGES